MRPNLAQFEITRRAVELDNVLILVGVPSPGHASTDVKTGLSNLSSTKTKPDNHRLCNAGDKQGNDVPNSYTVRLM